MERNDAVLFVLLSVDVDIIKFRSAILSNVASFRTDTYPPIYWDACCLGNILISSVSVVLYVTFRFGTTPIIVLVRVEPLLQQCANWW